MREKFYENPNTNMIHSTGDGFVNARTEGTTLCGQQISHLVPYVGNIDKEPRYRFCLRCKQLKGEA